MGEDEFVGARHVRHVAAAIVSIVLICALGCAQALTANVVMKVSKTTRDSIIDVGDDLSIDVQLDGVNPATYRWYFADTLIAGAEQRVISVNNAQVTDAGLYRVEAYDADGSMLVSMEFNVRVIDKALPKSGDSTLGVGAVSAILASLAAVMLICMVLRKKRAA